MKATLVGLLVGALLLAMGWTAPQVAGDDWPGGAWRTIYTAGDDWPGGASRMIYLAGDDWPGGS